MCSASILAKWCRTEYLFQNYLEEKNSSEMVWNKKMVLAGRPMTALSAQGYTPGLKASNHMQNTPATPASLPPLPQNPFLAPILDSGCTLHLTGHLQLLHKFAPHPPHSISVANNNSVMSYSSLHHLWSHCD